MSIERMIHAGTVGATTIGRAAIVLGTASWFGITVVHQFGRGRGLVRTVDPTGLLVPDWRFFAPRPAVHEYRVLVRDRLAEGNLTSWAEHDTGRERSPLHVLWAPHRRNEKAVFDIATELLRVRDEYLDPDKQWRAVRSTPGYLAMLTEVIHQAPHDDRATATQFLLVRCAAYDENVPPEPVLTSEFHHLGRFSRPTDV